MIDMLFRVHAYKPIDSTIKRWNDALRYGLKEAGEFWIRYYLPLHFTRQAVARYGYPPLSRKYLMRKFRATRVFDRSTGLWVGRERGHIPLVWTGAARASLLQRSPGSFNMRTTATSNRVRLQIPLNVQSGAPGGKPRLYGTRTVWEPMTKITPEELKQMAQIVGETAVRFLKLGG